MTWQQTIVSLSMRSFSLLSITNVLLNLHEQLHALPSIKLEWLAALQGMKTKSPVEKQFPAEMVTPQTQVTPRPYVCALPCVYNVCCGLSSPIIWFEFGSTLTNYCWNIGDSDKSHTIKGHCLQVNRRHIIGYIVSDMLFQSSLALMTGCLIIKEPNLFVYAILCQSPLEIKHNLLTSVGE